MHQCQRCPHFVAGICDAACLRPPSARVDDSASVSHRDTEIAALFERYHRQVVAWACRMSGSYELAKDIAQDVFVKAWTSWDKFRGDAQFKTWLYTITRNCYRDYVKARAARPVEVAAEAAGTSLPVVENEAIAALEVEHAATVVRRLMRDAHLDPIEARVFALHFGEDMPIDTVTARLGLRNRSGARAHIVSAKRKLRRSAERWQRIAVWAGGGGTGVQFASGAGR
jgi:RNA polymerase sigma-70 factor, ECF subfamily